MAAEPMIERMSGRQAVVEILKSEGVDRIFGNPGTTELALLDELSSRREVEYILGLQESTATAMAEGYAMATGRPSVVNLHSVAGLCNGLSGLANARANGTAMVAIAGQQNRRHLIEEPLLSGDLVGLASPVTKWSHEVRGLHELGTALRRAFRLAVTPPSGPVFVSIPMDVLEEVGEAEIPKVSAVELQPTGAALEELATLLVGSHRLLIVVGDEVARAGATSEAVDLAECLGAPVAGAPLYSRTNFPTSHRLWTGMLPTSASAINRRLAQYDRVLALGATAFYTYHYTATRAVPDDVELLQIYSDAEELGRTYPLRLGVEGNVRTTTEVLVRMCRERTDDTKAGVGSIEVERRSAAMAEIEAKAINYYDHDPIAPIAAAHALVRGLPPHATVVDEAVTASAYIRGFFKTSEPDSYFFCRGGGLGWGMPVAAGVQLARPGSPVLCVVGDGTAMYSPQALWTAAHYGLPIVVAVLVNTEYRILKQGIDAIRDGKSSAEYVALDLVEPEIDYLRLAESMGVPGARVTRADAIGEALEGGFKRGEPFVLEIVVGRHRN
jgi:benzoylformate decarboxylase